MATYYLRPSADIDFQHTKYPTSATGGYDCINEATADDDSRYIEHKSSSGSEQTTTSKFKISGEIPTNQRLDSAVLYFRARYTDNNTESSKARAEVGSTSTGDKTLTTSYQNFSVSLPVSELTIEGTNVYAELSLVTIVTGGSSGLSKSGDARITQAYIQVSTTQASTYTLDVSYSGPGTAEAKYGSTMRAGATAVVLVNPVIGGKVQSITDNGSTVTSKITETTMPILTSPASGASYGFALNSTGYWQSQNTGSRTAAVAQIDFVCTEAITVVLGMINYNLQGQDYGLVGKVDVALGNTYTKDSTANLAWDGATPESHNVATEQTVTLSIPAGEHFVQIKYRRNNQTAQNNNNFQVRIKGMTYTNSGKMVPKTNLSYNISNVSANHTVVVTFDPHVKKGFFQQNGIWEIHEMYQKVNGAWVVLEGAPVNFSNNDKIMEK